MKRIILFILGLMLLVAAVIYGSIGLYGQLKTGTANAETCKEKGTNHIVTIADGKMSPTHVTGRLCDTLTIKNTDDVLRYIAFGKHDQHQPYDGVSEKTMSKDQEFTITLNEAGDYKFHDHLHDETAGTFTVRR
jgi:plastocyanin